MSIRYNLDEVANESKYLTRRLGKVRFHLEQFRREGPVVRKIIEAIEGLAVDSKFDYYRNSLEMTLVSPRFDAVEKGCEIPSYEVEVTKTLVSTYEVLCMVSVRKID